MHRVCALESPATVAQLDAGGFDAVIACLQTAWLEWPAWPGQFLRVLKPHGRLLFCAFGPDTLREVRGAWAAVDDAVHAHAFIDMHHIGDALLRCGFARPIVDAEWVTVNYPNADALHADLRAEGFTNIDRERRKTLTGKARFAAYQNALERRRDGGGDGDDDGAGGGAGDGAGAGDGDGAGAGNNASVSITFELVYGCATAPATPSFPARIQVAPPGP